MDFPYIVSYNNLVESVIIRLYIGEEKFHQIKISGGIFLFYKHVYLSIYINIL